MVEWLKYTFTMFEIQGFTLVFLVFTSFQCLTAAKPESLQCKFPATWQSKVFFDLGEMIMIPGQMNASGTFYYDYPNKQMRLDLRGISALGNIPFSHTAIWRFHEGVVYVLSDGDTNCTRENYDDAIWTQWEGIPADATQSYFGMLVNNEHMQYLGQYILVRDPGVNAEVITLDVLDSQICPPFRMSIQDQSYEPMGTVLVHYEFMDHTELQNPKVFIPPPNCPNGTSPHNNPILKRMFPGRRIGIFMD